MSFMNGSNSFLVIQQLANILNKAFALPPLVILSALEGNDIINELKRKTKCLQFLKKPVNKSQLMQCFENAKII
mgnify:CR=1 FL=1